LLLYVVVGGGDGGSVSGIGGSGVGS